MAKALIRLSPDPHLPSTLATLLLDPATLVRVSGHDTDEPFFGAFNRNRFDDPDIDPTMRYGTCYFGCTLSVAICETLLHDRLPVSGGFIVESSVIKSRFVLQFEASGGGSLKLADLTGAALKRMGGNALLSGSASYSTSKKWSAKVYAHPDAVDGLVYMSRQKNDDKAVVLFDRACDKLKMTRATPLHSHPAFGTVATELNIRALHQ
ncbi:MAG: hypothetical protein JWR21_1680 [Herminiimonas sp.]|nr:hypothetical protein [Herminiimonas sp.]MDB5853653.1 hypothetical protein [Herminiimonas sp.]